MATQRLLEVAPTLRAIGPFPSVQIVPPAHLYEPAEWEAEEGGELAPGAGQPQPSGAIGSLTDHGGRKLSAASISAVYVGDATVNSQRVDSFLADLCYSFLRSPIYTQMGVGPGAFLGSVGISASGLPAQILDSQLQAFIHALVDQRHILTPTPQTMVMVFLPPQIQAVFDGSTGACCTSFCGYHSKTGRGYLYGIICDSSCTGCHGSNAILDGLLMVTAHEYAETATDPDGNGWFNDQSGMENGDECAWRPVAWGPWTVQPMAVNDDGTGSGPTCYLAPYVQAPSTGGTPQPDITLSISGPAQATVAQAASFSAAVTGPSDVQVVWDFGDGTAKQTAKSIQHAWSAAGAFTVTATALSILSGKSVTATASVTITAAQPQPPPGHFVPRGPMAAVWRTFLEHPQALTTIDITGLDPASIQGIFWNYLRNNPNMLQFLLDNGWGAWFDRQVAA